MAKVLVHNPTAPTSAEHHAPLRFPSLRESRVGILENTKPNAELLMSHIVWDLGQKYGVIKTMTGHKPSADRADPAVLDELAESSDWVLVGSAD